MTGTLHEDQYTFLAISRSFLLRLRNFSDILLENITIHVSYSVTFFENRAVYEIKRNNFTEPNRPQMIIWSMRIAC
jgi:hypothetical protein